MSLRDRLEAAKPNRRTKCFVCLLLLAMPDDDREALTEALDGDLESSLITKVLESEGYFISACSVRRHRRGECKRDN